MATPTCTPVSLDPDGFNPSAVLPHGLTTDQVRGAMQEFLEFIGYVDTQLCAKGLNPLAAMFMPANFSSLVGEFVNATIPRYCPTLAKNVYHNGYPDLIPRGYFPGDAVQHGDQGIEVKASRYPRGWQGHNKEEGWLMVYVFDAARPADVATATVLAPFRFLGVYAAHLDEDDWTFAGRSATSRRTITASVNERGYRKMAANWVYKETAPVAAPTLL